MSDRILQRYAGKAADNLVEPATTDETEAADELGAFGWLRGVHERAIMLELRKKNGNILAIGYSWMERVEFNPSEGITLHAAGQKIRITGRNLNAEVRPNVRLFQGIIRHKVPWIQEADECIAVQLYNSAVIIDGVGW